MTLDSNGDLDVNLKSPIVGAVLELLFCAKNYCFDQVLGAVFGIFLPEVWGYFKVEKSCFLGGLRSFLEEENKQQLLGFFLMKQLRFYYFFGLFWSWVGGGFQLGLGGYLGWFSKVIRCYFWW